MNTEDDNSQILHMIRCDEADRNGFDDYMGRSCKENSRAMNMLEKRLYNAS